MRRLGLAVLLVCLVATPAAGGGNEPPLADAGLDQQVQREETVLLDATGSRDPDGTIAETTWRVEAPNGTTFTPRCGDCSRARFPASRVGTYVVTLTVTDDAGATRTDNLRVRVGPSAPPEVTVTGPQAVDKGGDGTYRAQMAVPSGSLARVVWTVDGRTVARRPLAGERAVDTLTLHHAYPGRLTLRATVTTAVGSRENDTHVVRVQESFVGQPPADSWSTGGAISPTSSWPGDGALPADRSTTDAPAERGDSPQIATVPDERAPDVELNDARRRLWLAPREEPEEDQNEGVVIPVGYAADGGGASGAAYVGGDPDDESTEFVPVGAHAARGDSDPEPDGSEVHVRGLGGTENVTAGGDS